MKTRLFNTLGKKEVDLEVSPGGTVKMYVCGPTVYDYVHIGNLRTYIHWDILRRILVKNGFSVKHVMNITDVGHLQNDMDDTEDKIEATAKKEQKSPEEIAKFFTEAFESDFSKANILKPTIVCPATSHVKDMIELISKLMNNGFAYKTKSGVYFDVSRFQHYTELSGQSIDNIQSSRTDIEKDPEKRHQADFRLWQLNQPNHIQQWESPWGIGYPGWHVECSAMALKYLGPTLDIHCGGTDHIPIHHTNEIAQSEAATAVKFAKIWLHSAFLLVDNQKMSKSIGNYYTLKDIEAKGFSPLDFRLLILTTHYRSQMNFTWISIASAKTTRERWNNTIHRLLQYESLQTESSKELLDKINTAKSKTDKYFNDDMNTAGVLAVLAEFFKDLNIFMDLKKIGQKDIEVIISFLTEINGVFAIFDFENKNIFIPNTVKKLAEEREKARKLKDWESADFLRVKIESQGFKIQDTPDGFIVIK